MKKNDELEKNKNLEQDIIKGDEGGDITSQQTSKTETKSFPLNENAIIAKLKDIEKKLESFEIDLSDDDKDDDKKKGAIDIALGIIVLLAGIGALIFYTKGVNNGKNQTENQ